LNHAQIALLLAVVLASDGGLSVVPDDWAEGL
jgi:hypothetical protein